jgi:hypothetical protein
MTHRDRRATLAQRLGLLILLSGGLCGCASAPSSGFNPDLTNITRRPVYNDPKAKQLFLGGYAGANYQPYRVPAQ